MKSTQPLIKDNSLIINTILDYSYGHTFKCAGSHCEQEMCFSNVDNKHNGLQYETDLNHQIFHYYLVDKRCVNEANVDDLQYVNQYFGFIRIFCDKCNSLYAHQCRYCDNYDIRKYDICYNHRSMYISCMECGDYNYDLEKYASAKCECCGKNLCQDCMDKYKHWNGRWLKEMEQSDMMIQRKEYSKKRRNNYCKRKDKRYWSRQIEKQRSKKLMSKWNKRYLLSLNGY